MKLAGKKKMMSGKNDVSLGYFSGTGIVSLCLVNSKAGRDL